MNEPSKILLIGNYPPPMCGWAMQTKLVAEELRRRGHICEILKINQNRQVMSPEYIDVQNGFDYLIKVWRYARSGYRLNVHLNGMGRTGYLLALAGALVAHLVGQPALLTFHGGLPQSNFPRDSGVWRIAFGLLFRLAGGIACDALPIKQAIEAYGVPEEKVEAIATFSSQYLDFQPVPLPGPVEKFLQDHNPVFFSYVSFRPEYRLDVLREAMKLYRKAHPGAGYIWLGFPGKELRMAEDLVRDWPVDEQNSLLLLGNLPHHEFLTLLSRSSVFLRTPACDGVCASVLESLALGVPVVASENQRRPAGVVTYRDTDAFDLCAKLLYVTQHRDEVKTSLKPHSAEDNISVMAAWLTGEMPVKAESEMVAVG
jgi:glycosyltransferase involved in cell wall biosynthesis